MGRKSVSILALVGLLVVAMAQPALADDAPTVVVTTPDPDQELYVSPVTLSGVAADDVGVSSVAVAVRDRNTALWLQADGTWGAMYTTRPTVLDAPGAPSVNWTIPVELSTGSYGFSVIASDSAGTVALPKPWVVFRVNLADSAPTVAIASPADGSIFSTGPVPVSGVAGDNQAVQAVNIAVQNLDSGLWDQFNGSFGATKITTGAVLADPGSPDTNWSLGWTATAAGNYRIEASAVDNAAQQSAPVTVDVAVGALTLTGSIDAGGTSFIVHKVDVPAAGRIVVDLDWANPAADLSLFLKNGSGTNVAEVFTALKPESLTYVIPNAGQYRIAVSAKSGATAYEATLKFVPAVNANVSFADSISVGQTRTFQVVVGPGAGEAGRLSAAVSWDGAAFPTANLNAEIRDAGNAVVARANFSGPNPEVLTVLATTPGTYSIIVSATAGSAVPFNVAVQRPGNAAPTVTISTPAPGSSISGSPVTVAGTAQDDNAVDHVELTVSDLAGGPPSVFNVTVSGSGDWSTDLTFAADASIVVEARAFDAVGQPSAAAATNFQVDVDSIPTVVISLPGAGVVSKAGTLTVAGTSTADGTISAVELAVTDSVSGLWSQFDGTFGPSRATTAATISGDPSAPTFNATATLTAGVYRVEVDAVDNGGQRSGIQSVAVTVAAAPEPGTVSQSTWSANGPVYAVASDTTHLYLGGSFDQVGQSMGSGVIVDSDTGSLWSDEQVGFDGPVAAAVSDGMGGWFVVGDFDYVGSKYRRGAAQVSAAGVVTNWAPRPNGAVTAVAYNQATGTVYLSGSFATLRGSSTTKLVAVDNVNGIVKPAFVSSPNRPLSALELSSDGSVLYVGGTFEILNGMSRTNLGAVSTVNGSTTPFVANANAKVNALAVDGASGDLLVGGNFTTIGGQNRARLARLSSAATVLAWAADANGSVADIELDSAAGLVVVGGSFTTLAGSARSNLGAVALSNAALDDWAPVANGTVASVRLDGTKAYLAGSFTAINATPRQGLGAVDLVSDLLTAWNPRSSSTAAVALPLAGHVFVGGQFVFVNGVSRSNLAAINLADGAVALDWQADTDGTVRALDRAPSGNRLYVGGEFLSINGSPGNRIAAVTAATGAVDGSFAATTSDAVLAIEAQGAYVYLGGSFVQTNGVFRGRLVRVAESNGALDLAFQPRPSGRIEDLHLTADGSLLYAVGKFATIGGLPRNSIAAVNTTTFAVTSWNPAAYTNDQLAYSVDLSPEESVVYVASGGYKNNGGNRVHAIAAGSGAINWSVRGDGDAQAVVAIGNRVWVGSHWQLLSDTGQACLRLCVLDAATGALDTSWTISANSQLGVWDLDFGQYGLVAGGEFTRLNNLPRASIAHFNY